METIFEPLRSIKKVAPPAGLFDKTMATVEQREKNRDVKQMSAIAVACVLLFCINFVAVQRFITAAKTSEMLALIPTTHNTLYDER